MQPSVRPLLPSYAVENSPGPRGNLTPTYFSSHVVLSNLLPIQSPYTSLPLKLTPFAPEETFTLLALQI